MDDAADHRRRRGGRVPPLEAATATDDCYTWWSNRGQAYAKNVGWRLDYHLATPAVAEKARTEHIYKGEKFSDHAPITIGYDFSI